MLHGLVERIREDERKTRVLVERRLEAAGMAVALLLFAALCLVILRGN